MATARIVRRWAKEKDLLFTEITTGLLKFTETPNAMFSRAIAGLREHCLVVNLPSSVKAVRCGVRVLFPVL